MAHIDKTYIKSYSQYKEIAEWCKEQGTIIDSFGNTLTPYDYIPHQYSYPNQEEDDKWYEHETDLGEYTEEYVNELLNNIRAHNTRFKTEECWKQSLKYFEDEGYKEKYPTLESWCDYVDTWAEIPLWNTDHVFDVYLIKNCPVEFIQNRLKEQYGEGWSKEAFTQYDNSYDAIKAGVSHFDTYKRNGIKNPHFTINYKFNAKIKDDNIDWWVEVVKDNHFWDYDHEADYWFPYEECYYPKCDSWTSACSFSLKGNLNTHRIRRLLNKWNLPEGTIVKFYGTIKRYNVKIFDVKIKK